MNARLLIALALCVTGCATNEGADTFVNDTATSARVAVAPFLTPQPIASLVQPEFRPSPQAVLTVSTDSGADGIIDRVQRTTFNADHHRVMLEDDRDGDGLFERITTFTHVYDGHRLIRTDTDEDADGVPNLIEHREYTADGQLHRVLRDTDADGLPDRIEVSTYNADGRKTQWRVQSAKDVIESVQDWQYDAQGRPADRLMSRTLANGTVSKTRFHNRYDKDGRIGAMDIDLQGDGSIDNHIVRVYDDRGRLLAAETDAGNDGSIDNRTRYRYDDAGRQVEVVIDIGNDGVPNTVIYRDYQGFDRPSRSRCGG